MLLIIQESTCISASSVKYWEMKRKKKTKKASNFKKSKTVAQGKVSFLPWKLYLSVSVFDKFQQGLSEERSNK